MYLGGRDVFSIALGPEGGGATDEASLTSLAVDRLLGDDANLGAEIGRDG